MVVLQQTLLEGVPITVGAALGAITSLINGSSVGRGALKGLVNGAIQGAVSGAVSGGINSASSGGSSGSPQIEIATPTQAGDVVLETVPAVADVTSESGGSPVFSNIIGATVASSLDSKQTEASKNDSSNETIRLFVFSRPTQYKNGAYDHLFMVDGNGNSIELDVDGVRNKIFRDKGRTGYNKQFFNNLKGGLDITLDKRKFDDAFDKLKQRYESKPLYNPWDNSNDFIINLLREAGRPLTEEELTDMGITRQSRGFLGVIILRPLPNFNFKFGYSVLSPGLIANNSHSKNKK